jgi:hypothetical protein
MGNAATKALQQSGPTFVIAATELTDHDAAFSCRVHTKELPMTKSFVLALAAVALVLAAGWAVGQQNANVQKEMKDVGRFAVSPAGSYAVLVDSANGKTWILRHSVSKDRSSVWLPIERLEGKDAKDWLELERALQDKMRREQERAQDEAMLLQRKLEEIKKSSIQAPQTK